jgi:hypothetical protein
MQKASKAASRSPGSTRKPLSRSGSMRGEPGPSSGPAPPAHQVPRNRLTCGMSNFQEAKNAYNAAKFEFIVVELDLAVTFVLVAKSLVASEKYERNIQNARQAYASATTFLKKADLSVEMGAQINAKLARLEHLLGELGPIENLAAIPDTINDVAPAKDE